MEAAKLTRHADWPARLAAFLVSRKDAPFVWGANDCAMFAADAVLALTGVDVAIAWRGRYDTEAGAQQLLGEGGLLAAVQAAGLAVVYPKLAQRGDLILFNSPTGPALGIHEGHFIASPALDGGYRLTPMARAEHAWKVG